MDAGQKGGRLSQWNMTAFEVDFETWPWRIELTRGLWAIVDEVDYEWAQGFSWRASANTANMSRGVFYALRTYRLIGKKTTAKMHREIMERIGNLSAIVDHRNGNSRDNRRCNLRPATARQSSESRGVPSSNTSGVKGVCFHKASGKWRAEVNRKHLGLFATKEEAEVVRKKAAEEMHGEFVRHA